MPAWLTPLAMGAAGGLMGAFGAKKARKEAQAGARQQAQLGAQYKTDTQGIRDVLRGQIAGTGPSVAQMQQRQGLEQSNQQMVSAAAAGGGPLAWRSAQAAAQQGNAGLAGQLALTRANEQQAAMSQAESMAQNDYQMAQAALQAKQAAAAQPGWFGAMVGGAGNGIIAGSQLGDIFGKKSSASGPDELTKQRQKMQLAASNVR